MYSSLKHATFVTKSCKRSAAISEIPLKGSVNSNDCSHYQCSPQTQTVASRARRVEAVRFHRRKGKTLNLRAADFPAKSYSRRSKSPRCKRKRRSGRESSASLSEPFSRRFTLRESQTNYAVWEGIMRHTPRPLCRFAYVYLA